MSKKMNSFKKKLQDNNGKTINGQKNSVYNNEGKIIVQLEGKKVEVDKKGLKTNTEEIKSIVKDLIYTKSIAENEVIKLSSFCDVTFNLYCSKCNKNEIKMNLC